MEPVSQKEYADVIMPLAIKDLLTYEVPAHLEGRLSPGCRVQVPLSTHGTYTGIVSVIHRSRPAFSNIKEIIDGEAEPIAGEKDLALWRWISSYYMCSTGEVMKAALPAALLKYPPGKTAKRKKRQPADESVREAGGSDSGNGVPLSVLTKEQQRVLESMRLSFPERGVALLHGVTSSGKTEVYLHLIEDYLKAGRQVLYLVPEIALTTQLTGRIGRHFGGSMAVYHSQLTPVRRREVWDRVRNKGEGGARLVLGVRSSLFLPFTDLGLVIVDEEHDTSYKQQDPAPRYNARDAAIVLAGMHGGHVVLGSATPSIESYYNATAGKYSLFRLTDRHGDAVQPEIILANTTRAFKRKEMISHFTPELVAAIEEALRGGEQVMLFRNRRGFSPFVRCSDCGWTPQCRSCAVSLTYHRTAGRLKCHYCGWSLSVPRVCGDCGSTAISTIGFGTEKIEDELRVIFPGARVARMDLDTTGRTGNLRKLLDDYASHKTDILIGTQMISKGFDFGNLTVVGVLQADSMLNYPDFRSYERAFQMMEQVSGRSGRRSKPGKVIIQTADPRHPVIRMVLKHDYQGMYDSQLEERRVFGYPPFTRLVSITLRHRNMGDLDAIAAELAGELRRLFGKRMTGPEYPPVGKIQSFYVKMIMIKMKKDGRQTAARDAILRAVEGLLSRKGLGSLRVNIDIDPV